MTMTAVLVEQGHNRLRYLVTTDVTGNSSLTITTTGAASPDLLTDSVGGPIKVCANAFTNGLGKLAAGALTQAQARAIWLANNSDTVLGNSKPARCVPRLQINAGTASWSIDANVDGGGHPTVIISANQTGSCYLDIQTQGAIGI